MSARPASVLRAIVALTALLATANVASGSGLGFGAADVRIAADGLSPGVLRIKAMHTVPVWVNDDVVAHTVTFGERRCGVVIPSGGRSGCDGEDAGFWRYAGNYRYRVSEMAEADGLVIVIANTRRVTMDTSEATVRAGRTVLLGGTVYAAGVAPFAGANMPQAITVFGRATGSKRFVAIGRVHSKPHPTPCECDANEQLWRIAIHPRRTATYVARIVDRPEATVWESAESRRIRVRVIAGRNSR